MKLLSHLEAALLIEMNEDFGVAARRESMPGALQPGAEFMMIINLAIEDYVDRAVLIANGLSATTDINDTEPPHSHRNARLDKIAGTIRAAMVDRVAHPR